ncbi:hypothetical protein HYU07_07530 [Candidatus Woesearchaeota archaeon]|nr:hypothetical protein [Candidatus Woesearchaeota archaeon]
MKLEINITKKYLYCVLGFVVFVFIVGIAIAQASIPNPGHAASEIGEGTIAGTLTVSNNNVGIGTTGPLAKLSVSGGDLAIEDNIGKLLLSRSGTTEKYIQGARTGNDYLTIASAAGSTGIQLGIDTTGIFSPKVTMLTNGNVGIGTASPSAKLDVSGGEIRVGAANIRLYSNGGAGLIQDAEGMPLYLQTRSSGGSAQIRMTIDQNGNVGIGTSPTGGKLEISSGGNPNPNIQINSAEGRGIKIDKTGGGETLLYLIQNDAYNNKFLEAYGGGETPLLAEINGLGGAYFAGNVGIGTTSPAVKLEVAGDIRITNLAGSGNAYACVNADGQIYRSATACS